MSCFTSFTARMGNVKQALRLIIDELNDVDKAIDFCKEQDDAELWEDLIESSIKKPGEKMWIVLTCFLEGGEGK